MDTIDALKAFAEKASERRGISACEAEALLAAWIEGCQRRLTQYDHAILIEIGAVLHKGNHVQRARGGLSGQTAAKALAKIFRNEG